MGSSGERHTVRWLRLNAGLTVEELALSAQVAPNTVRKIERGERSTMLGHAIERRIADALGCHVEAVAFGKFDDHDGRIDLEIERERRRLSPQEVAEAARVPIRTVRRAEAGVAVQPRYALRLAVFYGCRVTDFYPREEAAAA